MCLVNVISLSQVVFLDCRKDIINRFLNPVYIPLVLVEWTLSKILFVALNWFPNGGRCLAVTLQNERGGRQRCFALDSSAGTVEGGGGSADFLWIHQLVQLRGEWQRLFSLDSSARTVEGVGRQRLFALFSSAAKDALIPIKPE